MYTFLCFHSYPCLLYLIPTLFLCNSDECIPITHPYIVTVLLTHPYIEVSDQYTLLCFHSYPYLSSLPCSFPFSPSLHYSSFCKMFLLLVCCLFLGKPMHFIFQLPRMVLSHVCLTVLSQRHCAQTAISLLLKTAAVLCPLKDTM